MPVRPQLQQFLSLPKTAWLQLLLGLGLSVGSLLAFAELVDDILEKDTRFWDYWAYRLLHLQDNPNWETLMRWMSQLGSVKSMVALSVCVLLWLYVARHDLRAMVLFLLSNLGGSLLNVLLKLSFRRDRPLLDPELEAWGYSLPSGHAMGAMIFYGFLAYLLIRSQRHWLIKISLCCLFSTLILLIGLSRIYLNAHYFSDVVAGFVAGSFWLTACILALEARPWYQKHFAPPEQPPTEQQG